MTKKIFKFDGQDPLAVEAASCARKTFRFFWRELSWEYRRIVPFIDFALVRVPFKVEPRPMHAPKVEHMWIGRANCQSELLFDGDFVSGILQNKPKWVTSLKQGAPITVGFEEINDWLFTYEGRAYGGFSVHYLRSQMSPLEREKHDKAWGLDFGEMTKILIEIAEGPNQYRDGFDSKTWSNDEAPFVEHRMCLNMQRALREALDEDPELSTVLDDEGWTLLHREALAGNFASVKTLVEYGADQHTRNPRGETAANLASKSGWIEIAKYLDELR